jgi:hypothetical protein
VEPSRTRHSGQINEGMHQGYLYLRRRPVDQLWRSSRPQPTCPELQPQVIVCYRTSLEGCHRGRTRSPTRGGITDSASSNPHGRARAESSDATDHASVAVISLGCHWQRPRAGPANPDLGPKGPRSSQCATASPRAPTRTLPPRGCRRRRPLLISRRSTSSAAHMPDSSRLCPETLLLCHAPSALWQAGRRHRRQVGPLGLGCVL